jgi:hypothetical protein
MHSHTKVWQMQELTVKNLKRIKQERVAGGGGGGDKAHKANISYLQRLHCVLGY